MSKKSHKDKQGYLRVVLKEMRVNHWLKNVFVFLPIIFSHNASNPTLLKNTFIVFLAFGLISSALYVANDIIDYENDKRHPVKSKRPIASNMLDKKIAFFVCLFLLSLSLGLSLKISETVFLSLLFYFGLGIFYSYVFKKIAYVDLLIITVFYLTRVYSGAFAIDISLTPWILIMTFLSSLSLISGKRLIEAQKLGSLKGNCRAVLSSYGNSRLKTLWLASLMGLFLVYLAYSVFNPNKVFLLTVPLVLLALQRYSYLVNVLRQYEDPVELAMGDKQIIIIAFSWVLLTFAVLYR